MIKVSENNSMTNNHDHAPLDTPVQLSPEQQRHNERALARHLAQLTQQTARMEAIATQPVATHEHEALPRASSYTIASETHPGRNEDNSFAIDEPGRVLAGAVFDGVGGQEGSERAAALTAETIGNSYSSLASDCMTPTQASVFAQKRFNAANQAIAGDLHLDIATTAAIASIHTNPETSRRFASVAWAGDSRVYIIRNETIVYRTLDDSIESAATQLDQLYDDEAPRFRAQAFLESVVEPPSGELAQLFKHRNSITNCIAGDNELTINTAAVPVRPGDIILATTDGIHDNLTNAEILTVINAGGDTKDLVHAALARSRDMSHLRAKRDDMTAVLLTA